ncbi:MAG: hypothetical protein E7B40_05915 [Actinomyces sp.]|nr:hypothetical protein [Actinomyces sp.]
MPRDQFPLAGRVIVITGVSRRAGIGYAIARRAAEWGADLYATTSAPMTTSSRGAAMTLQPCAPASDPTFGPAPA